tara:strand:+ start:11388 stop:11909 length:522 start_codon:yes stop_codon:yes gene_type:complete
VISRFLTHPIARTNKSCPGDPQRTRLYKLEREFIGTSVYHQASQKHLCLLARHVCSYYCVPEIRVVVYNDPDQKCFGESVSYSDDDFVTTYGHEIRLNRGYHGANLTTLLHELAHYISDQYFEHHRDHGAQFCAIYMHLLDKYRVLPAFAFRALAKKWGVKIAGRFKPAAIRG